MQAVQLLTRRTIILGISVILFFAILFRLFGDLPLEYYRNYTPSEGAFPSASNPNDTPQPGYFKVQPEWDFKVPASIRGWTKIPRSKDVIVLTASDGGGHNGAIRDVLNRVLQDRQNYCDKHGYTNLWLNTSRYDIGAAHRTWSKIPAVADAFHMYPTAEWVFLIDTDIIMMSTDVSLVNDIIAPKAIEKGIMRDCPILDGQLKKNPTNITTPNDYDINDIDILITQDHQSVNTGATFFRRSAFTRYLLEVMTEHELMGREHPGAEQDALKHLMLEHPLVRRHVGIYPQRKFNAYVQGGDNMGWRDGDLLVHFAGCWVGGKCSEWFEQFWEKRGTNWKKETWRVPTQPGGDKGA